MLRKRYYVIEFWAVTLLGLVIYCINIILMLNNTTYKYAVELWNYGRQYIHVLYPLIFSAPFCWLLFYEKSGGYWKNIFNRIDLKKYLKKRIVVIVCLSALAMFIISVGSFGVAYLVAPIGATADFEPIMTHNFYGSYQIDHPFMYVLLLSAWRCVLVALYIVFAIGITLNTKNIFVSMTGTFVYSIIENFVTAILEIPELSICTSFYPNRLSSTAISFTKLLVGPLILVIVTVAVYVYYYINGKKRLID